VPTYQKLPCNRSTGLSAKLAGPAKTNQVARFLSSINLCIYNSYMDVFTTLDGQGFVWDSDKASSNALQHGVRFEQAREAFLDPLARYEDASPQQEARQACIGLTTEYQLLYVVHVIREGDVLRLISARLAEPAERRRYEND